MPSDTAADFTDDYVSNLTSISGWKEIPSGDTNWLNSLLSKSFVPAARFLLFGSKGWIGEQFLKLLEEKKIEIFSAQSRPGLDPDEKIAEELSRIAPSHVVSMVGRTHGPGCGNIDYLEGGSDKLKENVQDNLYAPWILARFCEEFRLHFTYLGTGCLYQYNEEHQRSGKGYTVRNLLLEFEFCVFVWRLFYEKNFFSLQYCDILNFRNQMNRISRETNIL